MGRFVGRSDSRSVGRSVGWSVGRSVSGKFLTIFDIEVLAKYKRIQGSENKS